MLGPADPPGGPLPPYSCVILSRRGEDGAPQLLLEKRPHTSKVAPGKLTCFGGKREPHESPLEAIRRECLEELGWTPGPLERAVDLHVGGALTAWFYAAEAPGDDVKLVFEEGVEGVWVSAVDDPRISPWHRAVLAAWARGENMALVD